MFVPSQVNWISGPIPYHPPISHKLHYKQLKTRDYKVEPSVLLLYLQIKNTIFIKSLKMCKMFHFLHFHFLQVFIPSLTLQLMNHFPSPHSYVGFLRGLILTH